VLSSNGLKTKSKRIIQTREAIHKVNVRGKRQEGEARRNKKEKQEEARRSKKQERRSKKRTIKANKN